MYYTHTEDFVKQLYTKVGITSPEALDYRTIAHALGIEVYLWPKRSMALFHNRLPYIMLHDQQSEAQLWQDFCHELCHVLLHAGDQNHASSDWIKYQERKANYFMRHAAVPTYMLETCKELSVPYVTEQFGVEPHLAEHRINEYVHNKRFRHGVLDWNGRYTDAMKE